MHAILFSVVGGQALAFAFCSFLLIREYIYEKNYNGRIRSQARAGI
jgi:hypothetical protein